MKNSFVKIALVWAVFLVSGLLQAADNVALDNEYISVKLEKSDGIWKMVRLSRLDGSDRLEVNSNEFEILLFDGSRFTVDDYEAAGDVRKKIVGGRQVVDVDYNRKHLTASKAPRNVTVTYELGERPYVHKSIFVAMDEGQMIDRLQVGRFSTVHKASRGGFGEPVFVGNWFFGLDYPGFYSRHSDGFVKPDYYYRWFYMIDLDGGDKEFAPRDGLVSLFHFPGYAKKQEDGRWGIASKRFVAGISSKAGDNAELGLFDYIAETRKPPRSNLHFNNWYSLKAKKITIDGFVNDVYKKISTNLAKYGAKLDAMVPDHGWQNSKSFEYIYQPKSDYDPLTKISKALRADGTSLGIWIALDGTNNSIERGKEVGYRSAYKEGFHRKERWMQGKDYFDILVPKYQEDLKKALRFLLVDADVDYIKHDFNHNFTSHYITQRHAREACLDVTLDILAYERDLRPDVFQNYTNGSWHSPWWLQHADTLWMMSGDSGGSGEWPQLSLREGATTYRDKWFYTSFNNPERCIRPVIPIANFMTHGILFSEKKPYTDFNDILDDWANYVMMYFGRGTLLKELYITPGLLDAEHWKVLGMASKWAVHNQPRLVNTVYVGGNPADGDVYGYISWVDGRAVLVVRNPDRRQQVLGVPLDETVYYRGEKGAAYHARAVYPFVEHMPWKLVAGKEFSLTVPGDSVMVFELEPGIPKTSRQILPRPLPAAGFVKDDSQFTLTLSVPDEEMKRYDLLMLPWGQAKVPLTINGKAVEPNRNSAANRWSLFAYDLRKYRGQTLTIKGGLAADRDSLAKSGKKTVDMDAWLIVDREVDAPKIPQGEVLPFAISQNYRRLTQNVIPKRLESE